MTDAEQKTYENEGGLHSDKPEEKIPNRGGKLARHYKRYVRPTTKIVRGVGRFARGTAKLAARFPGTGLAATGLYYAGKHIIKKGEKIAPRTAFRQYNKKGKWMV